MVWYFMPLLQQEGKDHALSRLNDLFCKWPLRDFIFRPHEVSLAVPPATGQENPKPAPSQQRESSHLEFERGSPYPRLSWLGGPHRIDVDKNLEHRSYPLRCSLHNRDRAIKGDSDQLAPPIWPLSDHSIWVVILAVVDRSACCQVRFGGLAIIAIAFQDAHNFFGKFFVSHY